MKILRLFSILALTALAVPGWAQATASAPTAGQRQAAEALLNTIYSEASFDEVIDKIMAAQLKLHPEMQRVESEMRAFMHKYMSWTALKPDMITLYAREFTEEDLREMTRFYQSPVGQKAASRLPTMMQQGMAIGQRHIQEHLPELQKIFADTAPSHEDHTQK